MKRASTSTPTALTPPVPPDPSSPSSVPFPYRDYVAAKAAIVNEILKGPFYALVCGRSGTGKTSLSREVFEGLADRHGHPSLYWCASKASPLGLVRHVARTVHALPRRSVPETIQSLVETLRARAGHLLVWIDDAERVPSDTLLEMRAIAEFDHAPPALSVVFSGAPELKDRLDDLPLRRRITVRCHLEGLRRDELDAFLHHRFGSVEAGRVPTLHRDELFERTQGAPAIVGSVLQRALAHAGKGLVSDDHLREAFHALGL